MDGEDDWGAQVRGLTSPAAPRLGRNIDIDQYRRYNEIERGALRQAVGLARVLNYLATVTWQSGGCCFLQ